jgi:hypothetical protein
MPNFDPTSASRAVLIEVMNVLGVFRDKIVLIGGWVPDLLYPNSGHIGSLDVDLAVSQIAIGSNAYETILKRMPMIFILRCSTTGPILNTWRNVFGCCFPTVLPEKVMRFSKQSLPH